jgi:hypothetical protein
VFRRDASVSVTAAAARRVVLSAFAFQLLWFTGFFPPHNNPNELSRFEAVVAYVESGTFSIDETVRRFGDQMDKSVWNGRFYSNKAPGLIFAAIPVYRLLRIFFPEPREGWSFVFVLTRFFTVSLLCFLALARFARRLEAETRTPGTAAAVACAVAFGTPFLFYSRTFFSHAWTASLLFLAWDSVRTSEDNPRRRPIFLFAAGLAAGWAAISEYPAALVAAVLGARAIAGARGGRSSAAAFFAAGAIPALALLAAYDAVCFGSPWRLSSACEAFPAYAALARSPLLGFGPPTLAGILGTLFSPRRGVLIFSPFLLWSIGGWLSWWRSGKSRRDWGFSLAAALAVWLPIAGYANWDGGWSLGMRYLLPGVFFAAVAIPRALETPLSRGLFLAAAAFSVALHTLASLSYAHYPNAIGWPVAAVSAWLLARGAVAPNLGLLIGLSPWLSLLPAVAAVVTAFAVAVARFPRTRPGLGMVCALGVGTLVAVLFVPAPVWPSDSVWRERMAADLREWPQGKPKDLSRYNSQSQ